MENGETTSRFSGCQKLLVKFYEMDSILKNSACGMAVAFTCDNYERSISHLEMHHCTDEKSHQCNNFNESFPKPAELTMLMNSHNRAK